MCCLRTSCFHFPPHGAATTASRMKCLHLPRPLMMKNSWVGLQALGPDPLLLCGGSHLASLHHCLRGCYHQHLAALQMRALHCFLELRL